MVFFQVFTRHGEITQGHLITGDSRWKLNYMIFEGKAITS